MGKRKDNCVTFGDRLAYARKKKGLLQKQLAKLIGVSQTRICNLETGKQDPNVSMIRKIIKALEVSEDWLMGKSDNFSMKNPTENPPVVKLTKEQQKLVADNEWMISYMYHKIFGFFRTTDYEDYYGYAAIGLCKAAKYYSESYDENKGSFFAITRLNIQQEMGHAYDHKRKDLHPVKSINQPLSDETGDDALESIIPAPDEWEPLEYKILVESVYQKVEHALTPGQRDVFKPWLHKMELDEIAKAVGISYQAVILRIRQARDKCKIYYSPEEIFT